MADLVHVLNWYTGKDSKPFRSWFLDLWGTGFASGGSLFYALADFNVNSLAGDAGYSADAILQVLMDYGWIKQASYCPSVPQRAFIGLEHRNKHAKACPKEYGYTPNRGSVQAVSYYDGITGGLSRSTRFLLVPDGSGVGLLRRVLRIGFMPVDSVGIQHCGGRANVVTPGLKDGFAWFGG